MNVFVKVKVGRMAAILITLHHRFCMYPPVTCMWFEIMSLYFVVKLCLTKGDTFNWKSRDARTVCIDNLLWISAQRRAGACKIFLSKGGWTMAILITFHIAVFLHLFPMICQIVGDMYFGSLGGFIYLFLLRHLWIRSI